VLDGAAVFGQGQVEGGATAAAVAWIFGWAAGGVVVVTKFFVAQAGAAAAASVGEDVAALIAFRGLVGGSGGCVLHGWSPLPLKCANYSKEKT
jgi:CHASE2 domain-containing sensor protein